mgnify:CR=1 FL=1
MIKFEPHPEICLVGQDFNSNIHRMIEVRNGDGRVIQGVGCRYRSNYSLFFSRIASGEISSEPDEHGVIPVVSMYRQFIQRDLFFLAFFIMENPLINTPFGVAACRLIEAGYKDMTLDIYARGHLKTFLLSQAETIQEIVKNPELCQVIFSYKKPKADDIVASIKRTLEKPIMVQCFPDILYENPDRESPSWSIQNGIMVKRMSVSRKEKTVESYGIIEGMPTGGHWDRLVYDDIETADLAKNPDQLQMLIEMFNYSQNLGAPGSRKRVIGTYYSHCGLLVYIKEKKDIQGKAMYHSRIIPATDDGTINGKPIFLSQEELDVLKADNTFNQMQLCNPTPMSEIKLDFSMIHPIEPKFLPKNRLKFIIVDPAGDETVQKGAGNDSWAILCLSVKPGMDELGNSEVYIEDMISDTMGLSEAIDATCQMYMRNGRIQVIGVEKVGNDTTYEHIRKALKAKGRHIEIGRGRRLGSMMLLSPAGRAKNRRIEAALGWPLNNGKLFYSTAINAAKIELVHLEMNKFPFFHVDILDAWAYLYDILTNFQFQVDDYEDEEDMAQEYYRQEQGRSTIGGY